MICQNFLWFNVWAECLRTTNDHNWWSIFFVSTYWGMKVSHGRVKTVFVSVSINQRNISKSPRSCFSTGFVWTLLIRSCEVLKKRNCTYPFYRMKYDLSKYSQRLLINSLFICSLIDSGNCWITDNFQRLDPSAAHSVD